MNIIEKSRNKYFCYLTLFIYLIAVFTVSGLNIKSTLNSFTYMDKLEHFIEYFIMGILLFRFFHYGKNRPLTQAIRTGIVFGILFGISDELHQGLVGYFDSGIFGGIRDCSFYDFLADSAGILTSAKVYLFLNNRLKVNLNKKSS